MNDLNLAYLLDPTFQLVNTAGKPLTDGWLEVYIHGTRDKYYCYSDFEGTLHPFKIPLDSLGSNIVLASVDNAYDVYVYNKFGALVLSRYNVKPGAGGIGLDITSSDGSIVITQDGGNVDLSVSSLEPCVVIAKSSRTSNGIFELTEISHVGDLARIVNGQLTLDTGWWHYDADCTLDYTGADDLYDNLKITLSLSGEAEAISVDTHNYTIGHKDRISLSGDLHVTDDGQTCTIRVDNLPMNATLYIDRLSFHCIAKPGVYQPVDIVAGDGITVDDNNVVSVDDTIQRKLTEGEGITIDSNNVVSVNVDNTTIHVNSDNELEVIGGGSSYTAGENISIVNNVISVDDTSSIIAGDNISIVASDNGYIISASGGGSYEGGTNISIEGNVINCDIEIDSSASGSSNNPISNSAMVSFVNSSVGTNTAYFLGTSNASEFSEFYAWLNTLNPTNNDYVFWETVDNEGHPIYKRYKYNSDDSQWHYEYSLNNSSFTAVQWSAINSGLTSSDKTKLNGIEAGAQVNVQADWNASVALPSGILNKPTVPTASTSNPLMDGAASYGSGTSYARSNHRHPTDTSRQAALPTSGTATDTYAINISGNAATATKAAGANFKVLGDGTEAQLEVRYDYNTPSVIMDAVSTARGIWASGLAGAQYGKWALRIDNSSNEVELYGNSDTATKLKSGSVFCSTQHSKWYKIATFRQTNSNTNSSVGATISVIQSDLAFKSAGGKTEFGIYNFIERRSGTDTQWSYYNKRNEYIAIGELTGISFGIVPSIVNGMLNIDVYVKCNTLDYNNFTFTVLNSYGFGNDSQEKTVDVTLYNPVSTDGQTTVSGLLTASSRALYPAEIVSALPASPEDGVMYLIPET